MVTGIVSGRLIGGESRLGTAVRGAGGGGGTGPAVAGRSSTRVGSSIDAGGGAQPTSRTGSAGSLNDGSSDDGSGHAGAAGISVSVA
jgi:hypothetical protein